MGRLKTTTGVKGTDLDSKSKIPNNDKRGEKTQTTAEVQGTGGEFQCISEGLSVHCPNQESIPGWQAQPHCSELCSFHLSQPGCGNGALNRCQQQQSKKGTEPGVNLFSGLTVLGAKQNCCDGRVTLYFLIDQMARISDLCKPQASFPI